MFVHRMPSGVSDIFNSEFERAHNHIPLAETENVFYLSSVVVLMYTGILWVHNIQEANERNDRDTNYLKVQVYLDDRVVSWKTLKKHK